MRDFRCDCGSTVFFENTQCVTCGKALGWCPSCRALSALLPSANDTFQCGNAGCGARLVKCHNYAVEHVCNRCVVVADDFTGAAPLCDYCRYNDTIPDLAIAGNREMWARLELAKRRLLYTLDLLSLPYGARGDGFEPPLAFDFKADTTVAPRWWWSMGKEERVYTGHADGKITINLREADTVEREKTRVLFQEAHRTIVGHFRHEIAHYYWDMLIGGDGAAEAAFKAVFGDHESPTYAQAQQRYYADGPLDGWTASYVSPYATMHPWEDFAETFATYLDMVSVLDTALHMEVGDGLDPLTAELPGMVNRYIRLGVVLNELNRAMGLTDLVPEILAPPVVAKLAFVHALVRDNRCH